jgi:hypothetical protein
MEMNFNGYPVFKGLQKPLEFMGIRGRFLTYAAMVIGISFIGYILFSILVGKLVGFLAMTGIAAMGILGIFIRQKSGLHNRKRSRGIFVYHHLFSR